MLVETKRPKETWYQGSVESGELDLMLQRHPSCFICLALHRASSGEVVVVECVRRVHAVHEPGRRAWSRRTINISSCGAQLGGEDVDTSYCVLCVLCVCFYCVRTTLSLSLCTYVSLSLVYLTQNPRCTPHIPTPVSALAGSQWPAVGHAPFHL